MSEGIRPRACGECLRRAWLVASLAGHIEKAVSDTPGNRAHEVLALPDEELARAMARSHAPSFIERAAARDPERMLAAVAGSRAWAPADTMMSIRRRWPISAMPPRRSSAAAIRPCSRSFPGTAQ